MADKLNLNALGLANTALEGAEFDQIPDNLGMSFADPIQPGIYRFQLPANMGAIWAKVDSANHGERINAIFEDDSALTIVQSPGKAHDGEEYRWRVSNVPRERGKEKILTSDMDLLLRALGETAKPKTNAAYAQALMKYAGKTFQATQEFSYRCRDDKEIYVDDGQGGQAKQEGKMGCGARYYQRDVPKNEDGSFPVRITCANPECGASIRAFGNLGGFKA